MSDPAVTGRPLCSTSAHDNAVLRRWDTINRDNVLDGMELEALCHSLGLTAGAAPDTVRDAIASLQLEDKVLADQLARLVGEANTFSFDPVIALAAPNHTRIVERDGASQTAVIGTPAVGVAGQVRVLGAAEAPIAPPVSGTATGSLVAEDGSAQVRSVEMAFGGSELDWQFLQVMAQAGQEHGFGLTIRCPESHLGTLTERLNACLPADYARQVTVIPTAGETFTWVQDTGELVGNDVRGLARLEVPADEVITAARTARGMLPLSKNQGAVASNHAELDKMPLAKALGLNTGRMRTYLEGGNLLAGTRPDGQPFVLVGRDSVALNQANLSKQLNRPVSEAETLAVIAADLGVDPAQVHPVEQTVFHIDMAMSLVGDGKVFVNDSRQVYAQTAAWLRESADGRLDADFAAAIARFEAGPDAETLTMEAAMRRDLEAAGLTVVPVAGAYQAVDVGDERVLPRMNFFNAVRVQGHQGPVAICLGGDPRAERSWSDLLFQHSGTSQVRFLNADLTDQTLALHGGIACRSKLVAVDLVVASPTSVSGQVVTRNP